MDLVHDGISFCLYVRHYIPNLLDSLPIEVKIDLIHTLSLLFLMAINDLSSTDILRNVFFKEIAMFVG